MKNTLVLLIFLGIFWRTAAQNQVGINQENIHSSAVLEMNSLSKGFLLPSMSSTQKSNIANPAQGLFIYETTSNAFWYYNSAAWIKITTDNAQQDGVGDADSDTRIALDATNDNDQIYFYNAGHLNFRMFKERFDVLNTGNSIFLGLNAGLNDDKNDNYNVYIGTDAGKAGTIASRNIALGYKALAVNVDGTNNIALGNNSQENLVGALRNVAIGYHTLSGNASSNNHVAIGHYSLNKHTTNNFSMAIGIGSLMNDVSGNSNLAVGSYTLQSNIASNSSVAIGHRAGYNSTSSACVYLGYEAGFYNTSINRLFIANSNSTTPLIFGHFSNNEITINGNLRVQEDLVYTGDLTDVSDRRLKIQIKEETNFLSLLIQLQAYRYHLINSPSNQKEYGLIAQEVQSVFPTLVRLIDNNHNFFGLSYIQFIPLLVEAEKEQYQQLEELKKSQVIIDEQLILLQLELEEINKNLSKNSISSSIKK